jgi:hypothetical protein
MPDVREDEYDEDYGPDDDSPPYWFPGNRMPADAQRMGLTHHVPDGALLRGPSTFPLPAYECRSVDGTVQVRSAP